MYPYFKLLSNKIKNIMRKVSVILLVLVVLFPVYIYSQWIPVGIGTSLGGDIQEIKVYNNNMYAGGTVTLFRSTNGGDNWNGCLPGSPPLYAWFLTRNSYAIFCGMWTSPYMYYSTNNGVNWVSLTNFPSMAGAIFDLETDNNFIYAQTSMYFLKSSNNGQNWITENNPAGFNLFYSNGRLYSAGSGLKVSTNYGANWTLLLNNSVNSIWVEDSIIFVGVQDNGLARSGNYGQNFSTVIPGNIRVNSIYKYNNYVFAQADTYNLPYYIQKNFYVSTDNGYNFIKRSQGLDSVSVTSMVYYNNYIYIAVGNYGTTNVAIYKRLLQDLIGIKKEEGIVPETYILYQNYPNPFNQSTIIKFQIKSNEFVELKIYDINGKETATLVSENLSPGMYTINYNTNGLPSGVYFYKLKAGDFTSVKKMILIK